MSILPVVVLAGSEPGTTVWIGGLLTGGISDIDQLDRIINVLGNLTEEVWPSCFKLPDYKTISFAKIENPTGLEAYLLNRSADEISIVKRLVCYNPANRATAMELLNDKYFNEEPLPLLISELHVPFTKNDYDDDSPSGWNDYDDMEFDFDFGDSGHFKVETTDRVTVGFPYNSLEFALLTLCLINVIR